MANSALRKGSARVGALTLSDVTTPLIYLTMDYLVLQCSPYCFSSSRNRTLSIKERISPLYLPKQGERKVGFGRERRERVRERCVCETERE